jgi:hypothetical protein
VFTHWVSVPNPRKPTLVLDQTAIAGSELLFLGFMHLLLHHGIVRSFNNPVADVGEWLVSTKLKLQLVANSSKAYDTVDGHGRR